MPRITKALLHLDGNTQAVEGHFGVIAVERALRLLHAFGTGDTYLGLTELSRRARLNKATALRIARTLGAMRWLVQNEDGAWRLGPNAGEVGAKYQAAFDVTDVVRPLLRKLSADTGESASYFVREGDVRTCVARVEGPRESRGSVRMGAVYPLTLGSPGRVMLAFSGEPGELYESIRRRGYATTVGERFEGGASVAAPVFGNSRLLLGALSVAGPASRLGPDELEGFAGTVVAAAGRLSFSLLASRRGHALTAQLWHP